MDATYPNENGPDYTNDSLISNAYNKHIEPFLRKSEHGVDGHNCTDDCNEGDYDYLQTLVSNTINNEMWKNFAQQERTYVNAGVYFDHSNTWQPMSQPDVVLETSFESMRKATIQAYYNRDDIKMDAYSNELESHEGPANRHFVMCLVVVHIDMLSEIKQTNVYRSIKSCFEINSLVDNVLHMIKYRRCIKIAKCMYENVFQQENNTHHQYRAKILNVKHAHSHQDQSNTDIGIARRMIRQAQVVNFRNRYNWEMSDQNTQQTSKDTVSEQYHKAERYFTNPPMAPIMCASPPSMEKSSLSLLMVSFAAKMDANIQYGVSSYKTITKEHVETKLADLGWSKQSMPEVHVYLQDDWRDVALMNNKIHDAADNKNVWTFHVRDEAQTLVKSKLVNLGRELEASFPIFYGLSMCVSSTLLPTFMAGQMVGSIDSVRSLLGREDNGDPDVVKDAAASVFQDDVRRNQIETTILEQHWSFPVAPDFLVPPRGAFSVSTSSRKPDWYKSYYEGGFSDDEGMSTTTKHTTHYHGTHLYVTQWPNDNELGLVASQVLIDPSLVAIKQELSRLLTHAKKSVAKTEVDSFDLTAANKRFLLKYNNGIKSVFQPGTAVVARIDTLCIANEPIMGLSNDAAQMLEQAQMWLDDEPSKPDLDTSKAVGSNDDNSENVMFHPMLMIAPLSESNQKNGQNEWAVLLCKMAWLRFNRDYRNDPSVKKMTRSELKKKYAMAVLVYSDGGDNRSVYVGSVCRDEDFINQSSPSSVVSIVYDPTLPENRFNYQFFPNAPGTMYRTIFVPTLQEENYRKYIDELKVKISKGRLIDAQSADDFVSQLDIRSKTFMKHEFYDVIGVQAHPTSGGGDDDEEEGEEGEEGVKNEAQPMVVTSTTKSSITNVDAIRLRLVVTTHTNAQEAAVYLTHCNIFKVAALGSPMFNAVPTLQSTVQTNTTSTVTTTTTKHMFVPRYMSFALSEVNCGPDLSFLYQLVGKGFVDLKNHKLPSSWNLSLLTKKSFHDLIKHYGNAELLAGMVHGESLAGRIMVLGATLWAADSQMSKVHDSSRNSEYNGGYATRRLKGEDPTQSLTRVLFGLSMPSKNSSESFSLPNTKSDKQRVFGNLRATFRDVDDHSNEESNSDKELSSDESDTHFFRNEVADLKAYYHVPDRLRFATGVFNNDTYQIQKATTRSGRTARESAYTVDTIANEVVNEHGMASNLFTWYINELCMHMTTIDIPVTDTPATYDKEWIQAVRMAHRDHLMKDIPWVNEFLQNVKCILLDWEFGESECADQEWIRLRKACKRL